MEYEEKRANMSLTQAELDKENDYYCRQSSPLHEPDDGTFGDDIDDIVGMHFPLKDFTFYHGIVFNSDLLICVTF